MTSNFETREAEPTEENETSGHPILHLEARQHQGNHGYFSTMKGARPSGVRESEACSWSEKNHPFLLTLLVAVLCPFKEYKTWNLLLTGNKR